MFSRFNEGNLFFASSLSRAPPFSKCPASIANVSLANPLSIPPLPVRTFPENSSRSLAACLLCPEGRDFM